MLECSRSISVTVRLLSISRFHLVSTCFSSWHFCGWLLLLRTACFTQCPNHWLSTPRVVLSLGSVCVHQCCSIWRWLPLSVWVTASTHISFSSAVRNTPRQFFFCPDPSSFNYFVRSMQFITGFGLKQKYFARPRVSGPLPKFPALPSLLSTFQGSRNFMKHMNWRRVHPC